MGQGQWVEETRWDRVSGWRRLDGTGSVGGED